VLDKGMAVFRCSLTSDAAEAAEIEGVHPLPEGPWIFSRSKLTTPQAQQIADRARQNPRYPAGSHPNQENLFPSTT
jgi:hypothetical protein